MNKQAWLDTAEVIDALRVMPRILVLGYCSWAAYVIDRTLSWYFTLPDIERTVAASGMVSIVTSMVTTIGGWVLKIYVSGGRDWQLDMMNRTRTTATTVETVSK
jgi:hypothetical protein